MSVSSLSRIPELVIPPVSYAPPSADPVRLAGVTIQAVDKIGLAAAAEIDDTAAQILQGAAEVAGKLRELAEAIRSQSEIARTKVDEFCGKAVLVIKGVREMQDRIGGKVKLTDEPCEPVPQFLAQGPMSA